MNVHPIFFYNRMNWPFPKHCFCLPCFRFLLLDGFDGLFLIVFTDVFLHLLPNCFTDLRIFNVVRWCAVPLHSPIPLSELLGTCWQLVGFLTFVSAGYWNGSFMNCLYSCVTLRVKIVWWNWCKCRKAILDFYLKFSPMMLWLTCIYIFWLGDNFFVLSNLVLSLFFSSYQTMVTSCVQIFRLLRTDTSRKMSGLSVMI